MFRYKDCLGACWKRLPDDVMLAIDGHDKDDDDGEDDGITTQDHHVRKR